MREMLIEATYARTNRTSTNRIFSCHSAVAASFISVTILRSIRTVYSDRCRISPRSPHVVAHRPMAGLVNLAVYGDVVRGEGRHHVTFVEVGPNATT